MSIKIRKEFGAMVSMHEKIINALKTQKVRQDQLLMQYEDDIKDEINLPANRFLNWSRIVRPYLDSINSGKIMDIQLLKQYERMIKDLVNYESDYILSEQEIADLEYNYDALVDIILKLETKIIEYKKHHKNEMIRAKVAAIEAYQRIPFEQRPVSGFCVYCGIKLNSKLGDYDEECNSCYQLPDDVKPFLISGEGDEDANEDTSSGYEEDDSELVEKPKTELDIPVDDEDDEGDEEEMDDEDESLAESMDTYEKEVEEESSPKSQVVKEVSKRRISKNKTHKDILRKLDEKYKNKFGEKI